MAMTMEELRGRLVRSFETMIDTYNMDPMAVKSCVNDITGALMEADFPISAVKEIENKCENVINAPRANNKGKLVYEIVLSELFKKLDLDKTSFNKEKVTPTIVMFIGLQGVKKTDMCLKYARYHLNKGFRPALVCADTFNTDEHIRLKRVAKDEIPTLYQGSETDPARLAAAGIEKFKEDKHDLIIVDTNGGHEQYSTLFEEMRPLAESMKPHLVIYVIDGRIGQAAFDQVQAFKQSFGLGIVMVTKVNRNSKACGAISAVAAAKCDIILAEIGEKSEGRKNTNKKEKSEDFEAFDAKTFLRRLFINPWLLGDYTLREMYTLYKGELGLDTTCFQSFPVGPSKPDYEKMRLHMRIMDNMTKEELDKPNVIKQVSKERMVEIAQAANVDVKEVVEMMSAYITMSRGFKAVDEGRCPSYTRF